MIGQTISHYTIIEKLGEGGMGVVYKARDTKLDRDVALKFLPGHVSATKETTARFLQEAKAAAALNHSNICTIYGVEEHDGRMFIAMEYIDGGTLREKLPLSGIAETASVAAQVGEALQEAHSKGIVHRDIKADNVMLTSKGQVKVMDFGLAKLKGSLKLTKTSSTVGTLGYMAPEQIGGGEVDARSDLFSFGVLIFEMLTGRLPFRGEHEAAMVYSIMNEEPEPITKFLPEAPPELVLLVSKALEKDPSERYQSVAEMLIDLRRLKKSTTRISRQYPVQSGTDDTRIPPSGMMPSGGEQVLRPGGVPSTGAVSVPGAVEPGARKRAKSKKTLYAGAAVLAIAAALLIFFNRKVEPVLPSAANMKMTRLTSAGNAGYATISPDGKYVVYVKGEPGEFGLWIRQVATGSEVMVIPPSDVRIIGSTFSNDGNYVYYTASVPGAPIPTVYRIPVLGGTPPRKIIENANSPVSLSPDDARMAFLRTYSATGEEAIFVANTDGSGERKLISRDGKNLFYMNRGSTPAWSPDGKVIVCSAGTTVGTFTMDLVAIDVDEPREHIFTAAHWTGLGRAVWHPDGRGLLVCTQLRGEPSQISYVSYPDGRVSRITNDLLGYGPSSLSVTRDASAIVSAQTQTSSVIAVAPGGDAAAIREITRGATRTDGLRGIDWLDDRRIVYTSGPQGSANLWVSGIDGEEGRQITFGAAAAYDPACTGAGGAIYYTSGTDSVPCTWVADADGSNTRKLTGGEDYNPEISPDGSWLLFDSWRSGAQSIWKQRLRPPDEAAMFRSGAIDPRFSPDGNLVACRAFDGKAGRMRMTVLTFPAGETVSVFDFPTTSADPTFQWAPDGRTLQFEDSRRGVSNVWSYDYRTGVAKQVTGFTSGEIFGFSWSPEGKNLAVARGQTTSDIVLLTLTK